MVISFFTEKRSTHPLYLSWACISQHERNHECLPKEEFCTKNLLDRVTRDVFYPGTPDKIDDQIELVDCLKSNLVWYHTSTSHDDRHWKKDKEKIMGVYIRNACRGRVPIPHALKCSRPLISNYNMTSHRLSVLVLYDKARYLSQTTTL